VRLTLPQCLILPVTLSELTTLLIIRSQRSPLPTDGENQSLASRKQKPFDASLDHKNNRIDMAGASKHPALSPSTSQGAGNGSSEHLIDGQGTKCPYHSHIFQEPQSHRAREALANTMDRFMIHHPGEQYAIFNRPDNKKMSIYRECICPVMWGDNFGSTETEYKLAEEETNLSGFQVGLRTSVTDVAQDSSSD
jgi:hypothetical protein